MAEDICLPRLAWDPATESILNKKPRKRARLSPPVSSDPPIFSSDDDPSVDNYTQARRKRTYRGPWYRQQPASDSGSSIQDSQERDVRKTKRTFERQFDSGVWLGSDDTDADATIEALDAVCVGTTNLPVRQARAVQTTQNLIDTPEGLAQRQIELCLETGNETIDLS
jgi:hypothetical protein